LSPSTTALLHVMGVVKPQILPVTEGLNVVVLCLAVEALRSVVQRGTCQHDAARSSSGVDLCRKLVSDGHLVVARSHEQSECSRGHLMEHKQNLARNAGLQKTIAKKVPLTRSGACIVHIVGVQRPVEHFLLPPTKRRRTVFAINTLTEVPFLQEYISPGNSDLPRMTGPWGPHLESEAEIHLARDKASAGVVQSCNSCKNFTAVDCGCCVASVVANH